MPTLTSEQARALQAKRQQYGATNARAEARKLQRLVLADALKENIRPITRVACVRAWDMLEERLRILNGRPLPGHLRPDVPDKHRLTKRKAPVAPLETLPDVAPKEPTIGS